MYKTGLLVNMINAITPLLICLQDKHRDSSICIMMTLKLLDYTLKEKWERRKAKELVQGHNVSYYPALGAKENNKNPWTVHLLFCITYWKLDIRMSAAHNQSGNTDINWKCLRPNNKYSLKVLWVKYQISSAHAKCQINVLSVLQAYSGFSHSSHQLLPYFQAPHSPAILR